MLRNKDKVSSGGLVRGFNSERSSDVAASHCMVDREPIVLQHKRRTRSGTAPAERVLGRIGRPWRDRAARQEPIVQSFDLHGECLKQLIHIHFPLSRQSLNRAKSTWKIYITAQFCAGPSSVYCLHPRSVPNFGFWYLSGN